MKVYGQINYTGTMKYQGTTLNLEYIVDDYQNGLTLTKGYIGGGYVNNAGWTVVTTIQNSTDAWGTSANASLGTALRYCAWSSSHVSGYMHYADQGNYLSNKKMAFSNESVSNIGNRNYGSYNPYFFQHGIGYNSDGSFYGTKAFSMGTDSTNYDKLNYQTDAWTAASDGSIYTGNGTYSQAWFDKLYGFSLATDNVTRRYPFSTETWGTISPSPSAGSLQSLGAWPKSLPTKNGKTYVGVGNGVYPILQFKHITYTYQTNPYNQTLFLDEQSPVMGQFHGYLAGGYNGTNGQVAHTDRVEYLTDTVINIPDAPRALSSGAGMWSGY